MRVGIWYLKNYWSCKILVEFHRSYSLSFFFQICVCQSQFFTVKIVLADIWCLNILHLHLKHFDVLVSQIKNFKCLKCTKKNHCYSRLLAKSCILHSPPLLLYIHVVQEEILTPSRERRISHTLKPAHLHGISIFSTPPLSSPHQNVKRYDVLTLGTSTSVQNCLLVENFSSVEN